MTRPHSPLLIVDDLATCIPTARGTVHALDGVSFEVHHGEVLGIVGESGSGKSMLARSIMGLTPPGAQTRGRVLFEGRDLSTLSRDERRSVWGNNISMVFQDPMRSLNPVVRVGRQITESLRLHCALNRRDAKERAITLLRQVGIPEPEQRVRAFPHELSGGMRQRICIAIAIACSPKVLLADEPTTALDVTIQHQILELLLELQRMTHMSMILITHDMGVVATRANRILVMYGGQIVETAPTKDLFRAPRHPYTAALLAAVPRIDDADVAPPSPIPGRPVDVIDPTRQCRFAARCAHAQTRCLTDDPVLERVAAGSVDHRAACFHPIASPRVVDAAPGQRSTAH